MLKLPDSIKSSGLLEFSVSSVVSSASDLLLDNVVWPTMNGAAPAGDGHAIATTVGSGPVSVSGTENIVSDADSTQMHGAHVTLAGGAQTGDHLLVNGSAATSGTLASGIKWTNTGTDVVLSGDASVADYQDALKLVQFDTSGNVAGTRTINSTVNDGVSDSNVAVTTIKVAAGTETAAVTGIALTSATTNHAGGNDHAVDTNDVLTYTVNFDHVVDVNTAGGTPQLALNIGGVTKYATYSGGSGSNALTFTYTVQDADFDANGVSVGANSLSTNGGSITPHYGTGAATLTHAALADDPTARIDAIDLGAANGLLIHSVQVEGNWYYAWDKNGDGVHNDVMSFDSIDGIFNHDASGAVNTTVANVDGAYGTTNDFRFADMNGLKLALPTYGGPVNGARQYVAQNAGGTYFPGTAVSGTPSATADDNPTYDGLLAIWDASNGSGTVTGVSGIPSGWGLLNGGHYRSATAGANSFPGSSGHAGVFMGSGMVQDNGDSLSSGLVALQVL